MKEKLNNQNAAISILKIFLTFVIIDNHFEIQSNNIFANTIDYFNSFAVCSFMFISFYLINKLFYNPDISKYKERIKRLYIPVVIWEIITILIYYIFKENYNISITKIILNLFFSHSINDTAHLWFLVSQVYIISLLFFLSLLFEDEKKKSYILIFIIIFSFILEYFNVNYYAFNTSISDIRYTLGRTIECLPYACSALLYSKYLHSANIKRKVLWILCLFILLFTSCKLNLKTSGFDCEGIINYFKSLIICLVFINIPNVISSKLKCYINYVSSCTMGIYCSHLLIGNVLLHTVYIKQFSGTILFNILIFVLGLVLTILIRFINKKIKWKWLEYSF